MTRIVAITGGSGAGKTTIARALAHRLGAGSALIAEDDYYRCASSIRDFDAAAYNFDAPKAKEHALLCEHLTLAKRGAGFAKPLYELATHRRRAETEAIAPADFVIVEGIHLLASAQLRAMFDLKVYVDADEALRLGRRIIRDVESRGRTARSVMAQFFATVRPMHEAHVAPQKAFADLTLVSGPDDGPDEADDCAALIAERLEASP